MKELKNGVGQVELQRQHGSSNQLLYINLFQQGLRFEKNQTEDDMDKVRQKYCELASRELSSS